MEVWLTQSIFELVKYNGLFFYKLEATELRVH